MALAHDASHMGLPRTACHILTVDCSESRQEQGRQELHRAPHLRHRELWMALLPSASYRSIRKPRKQSTWKPARAIDLAMRVRRGEPVRHVDARDDVVQHRRVAVTRAAGS